MKRGFVSRYLTEDFRIAPMMNDTGAGESLRQDGTAYHVVDDDPATSWIRGIHGWQGADVRTAWARGQSWGSMVTS